MIQATVRTYRNAYSGLSRETWLLSLIMLVNRSGTMVVPFMTLYLTSAEMGYSIGQAGFVFGLFGAGAFSGAWLGGKLTDKIGFYPIQLITLAGGGVLFILLGQMKTFPLICIFTFLLSFVNEAFRPANSTAIAFYSREENRTRSYALNRLAINLGWAVGSGLGGFLAHINYELLFWVDGATNLFAAMMLAFLLKPVKYKGTQHEGSRRPGTIPAYRDRKFVSFIIITVLFAACFFQLFTNIPVFFRKELHLSEPYIGFIMALNGIIIAILEMVLVYKLEGRQKNLHFITFGVLLIAIAFALLNMPLTGAVLSLVMILVVTVGEIFALPFMNTYWIERSHSGNRGQYAALYTMSWSAAQTLGPMAGAQLAQYSGFNILWWAAAGICICSAFFYYELNK
jgi:predicted MFS family arabinose efflux permease